VTIRATDGTMHEFQASKETLPDLEEGDRIEARLRHRGGGADGVSRAPVHRRSSAGCFEPATRPAREGPADEIAVRAVATPRAVFGGVAQFMLASPCSPTFWSAG